jgi:2-keto-4-pentenoate hydratase
MMSQSSASSPVSPNTQQVAQHIWRAWQDQTRMEGLPQAVRPQTVADGYAAQAALVDLAESSVAGWKIAATSLGGQQHINVDGPLAGRLFTRFVLQDGASVPIGHNNMQVCEAEFAFVMQHDLPATANGAPYTQAQVVAAMGALHTAIEVPDSRYMDFVKVGMPQLIADNACAAWFVLGPRCPESWRTMDLSAHKVSATVNGQPAGEGTGANVLGDPRIALTWIANALPKYGAMLRAGDIVTTGTCIVPAKVKPGDLMQAHYGALGLATVKLTA